MSTRGSAKKNVAYNEANELLYEAVQPNQLPEHFPVDPPWPEWSDAEINAETWGESRHKSLTSKGTGKSETVVESPVAFYLDLDSVRLPLEVEKHVADWKRPHEVFPADTLVLYDSTNADLSLRTPSEFGASCELYKMISDMCCILHFHATMEPFPVESETLHYVPNTRGQPWHPCHHVYGSCKAGKDQAHRPVYYPYGKYVIRLYYLGAWRRFVVDDRIPCDAYGKCLLPVTHVVGELWPILVVKGVLKIAALSPRTRSRDADLPLWTLFTGWFLGTISVVNKSGEHIWRWMSALCPRFAPPDASDEKLESRNRASTSSKGATKRAVAERRESGARTQEDARPILLIAELANFPAEYRDVGESVQVAILMIRDVPLKKSSARKPTEPWKRIRWVHWAAKKGIWTDEQLIPPYRCLYQINLATGVNDLIAVDPNVESRLFTPDEAEKDEADGDGREEGGEEEKEEQQQQQREEPEGSLLWVDFFRFINYLSSLVMLVRPSALLSRYKITYLTLGQGNAIGGGAARSKSVTNSPEPACYYMLPGVKVSSNEPPILYCESHAGIFICFSLWVCPQEALNYSTFLAADQPEFLKVYRGSVIVETYDWRTACQNSIVGAIKTTCNGTACVLLSPGRHAFRIWLDSDSPFVIEMCANAELTVGKGSKIRFLMSTESGLITRYIHRVAGAFFDLVAKYGKAEHARGLVIFYDQIKPLNSLLPNFYRMMDLFYDTFLQGVATVLRSIVSNDDELRWMVKALQSMFVHVDIHAGPPRGREGPQQPPQPQPQPQPQPSQQQQQGAQKRGRREHAADATMRPAPSDSAAAAAAATMRAWTDEDAEMAIRVQSAFRGHRVRKLREWHSPSHRDHRFVVDKLKKIGDVMFSPSKREVEVARLIREMISAKPEIFRMFRFHRDVPNVTVTEEFTGKIPGVEPKAWVPMIRFIFSCHGEDPLPCAFYLSCNLEQYTVTVTNNDTNEEVFRLVNATCPHYYPQNDKGFTLFVYGWNELEPKAVNWKLEMIKMKYFPEIHPCNTTLKSATGNQCNPYLPQSLTVQELRNFYVPNKENRICTCLIKIRKRILLTIRLSVSYENARFNARIYLRTERFAESAESSDASVADADAVIEGEAKSSAIIFPSVFLEHYDRRRSLAVESRTAAAPPGGAGGGEEESDRTVYVLEAYVVSNSWPLTKHEWGIVEQIRVNGESWQESASQLSLSQSRKSSTGSSRRRAMRSSKSLSGGHKAIENPYWYLQVVSDSASDASGAIEVTEDRSYQEMIKGMKASWEENDPGRRQRGRYMQREFLKSVYDEARESRVATVSLSEVQWRSSEYLDPNKMSSFDVQTLVGKEDSFEALLHEMKSFSYLVQDRSTVRYQTSPRLLPWVPLQEMFARYSRGKDADDYSSADSYPNMASEDYVFMFEPRKRETVMEDERTRLLKRLKKQQAILEEYIVRELNISCRLAHQSYRDRGRAVQRMKHAKEKLEAKSRLEVADATRAQATKKDK